MLLQMLLPMNKILLFFLLLFSLTAQADITARSWIVADGRGNTISEKDALRAQSIASITKLMTVLIVLKADQPQDEIIKLDWKEAGRYHTRLPHSVKSLTRDQLIDLALIKSDNFAAHHLCHNYPGGYTNCVQQMNNEADRLGMIHTHFDEATGLDEDNVSTAYDLVKLVLEASKYPDITDAGGNPVVRINVKKHWWEFKNTNPLVKENGAVRVSKTGYIHQSGGCIAMLVDTEVGPRVIVLLGSRNTHTRIPEAQQLILNVSNKSISVVN
jgi:D-alanyl-D-alanine endopeptidase (penicillin-binding protein 7)